MRDSGYRREAPRHRTGLKSAVLRRFRRRSGALGWQAPRLAACLPANAAAESVTDTRVLERRRMPGTPGALELAATASYSSDLPPQFPQLTVGVWSACCPQSTLIARRRGSWRHSPEARPW